MTPAEAANAMDTARTKNYSDKGPRMNDQTTEREALDAYNYTEQEEAVRAYADLLGEPVGYVAGDVFEDGWNGEWESPERFAENLAESTGQLDREDWLHGYVDWSAVVDDLHHDYDFIDAPNGNVFVFRVV